MAVYDPDKSWQLLSEAARWEHLAEAEIFDHFKHCNAIFSKGRSVNELAT